MKFILLHFSVVLKSVSTDSPHTTNRVMWKVRSVLGLDNEPWLYQLYGTELEDELDWIRMRRDSDLPRLRYAYCYDIFVEELRKTKSSTDAYFNPGPPEYEIRFVTGRDIW